MLRPNEIATIRAALQFWKEEICPHGEDVARLYLEPKNIRPLPAAAVEQLRQRFVPAALGYLVLSADASTILDAELFATAAEAERAHPSGQFATVVLPAD